MANVVRDLVEISGIADTFPVCPKAFTEVSIMENITIPVPKPDIEQILRVIAEINVISKRVVETPIGKSSSGIVSTGVKLIIELELKEKIVYVADEPSQPVHAAEFGKVFSSYIILPKLAVPITPSLPDLITAEAFIEDIFIKIIDKRNIFKNVTAFFNASSNLFLQ